MTARVRHPSPKTRLRCHNHRKELAGWRCDACRQHLCGRCTALVLTKYYCCSCDGEATQLTIPRVAKPFSTWLFDALSYPARRGVRTALIALIATGLSLAAAMKQTEPTPPPAVEATEAQAKTTADETREVSQQDDGASGNSEEQAAHVRMAADFASVTLPLLLIFYVLLIVGTSARHGGSLDLPSCLLQLPKMILATLIVWGPGVAYLHFVENWAPTQAAVTDEVVLLFGGLSLVYLPVSFASTSAEVHYLHALNPFKVFDWLWRMGGRYWVNVCWLVALSVGAAATATAQFEWFDTETLNTFARMLLLVALLAAISRLIGLMAHVHGDVFDWGLPVHYLDPLLPDAEADGVCKHSAERPNAAGAADDGEGAKKDAKPELEQAERRAVREIAELIRADNMLRALKRYTERESWTDGAFNDRQLIALGRAAGRAKNFELAERTLEKAIAMGGVAASRAIFALARMHATALENKARAQELFQKLLDEYPESDLARQAKKELEQSGS